MKRLSTFLFILLLMLVLSVSAIAQVQIIGDIETSLTENNEIFVRLNTGDPSMASVEYGVDGKFEQTAQKTSLTGEHNFFLSDLAVDSTYTLRVHVSDWSGNHIVSEDIPFTTPGLVSPDNVKASTRDNEARLSWSPVLGGAEYVIERANTADGPFEAVATVDTTSYTDSAVENEAEYFYRVSAVDAAGNKAAASAVLVVVIEPHLASTDFTSDLDMDFWRFHEHNPTAKVEIDNGRLVIYDFTPDSVAPDKKTAGIVNRDPIDMTGVTTVIEVGYSEVRVQELNLGFSDKIIHDDDPWWNNGFRLTGRGNSIDSATFDQSDVTISPSWNFPVAYPLDLRWELTHTGGKNFDTTIYVNGEQQHTGSINFGSLNPENMHFYFYVSESNDGFAAANYLTIYQE